jgi:glycine/D-amino acid oxidase-like deaminating enzyme
MNVEDVIVIGGGIAGCATAYYLAADGVSATLVEASDLNTLASGANAGSLHAQIPHEPFVEKGPAWAAAFAPATRLFRRSIALWQGLSAELQADLEVAITGGLIVASSDDDMRAIERKAHCERAAGLSMELLDGPALRRRGPYLSGRLVGGAYCPEEGKANPLAAAPAFAAAAQKLGGKILRRTEVSAIAREGEGYAIATSAGTVRCRRLVNAAGSDAGRIAAMLGVALNVEAHPIQVSVSEPIAPLIPHLVYYAREKLTLKQTRAGALLIGGGWPARLDAGGRPITDPSSFAANLAVALEVVPAIAGARVVRSWAAIVNGTPDWLPILGEVPGRPGFFVNFVPWMGFTAAPAAARIVASMVQGRAPPVDFDVAAWRPGG